MEKLRNLAIVVSFRDYIKRMKLGGMNPDFAWKVVLIASAVTLSAVSVGAYVTLDWAQSIDQTGVSVAQKSRDALSPEDLHSVVEIYEAKENTYRNLLLRRPLAPSLKAGPKIENTVIIESATTSEEVSGIVN